MLLLLQPVVGEFSVGGVTSPSWDQNAAVPIELINEAMVAATFVNGTVSVETEYVVLVVLTLAECPRL